MSFNNGRLIRRGIPVRNNYQIKNQAKYQSKYQSNFERFLAKHDLLSIHALSVKINTDATVSRPVISIPVSSIPNSPTLRIVNANSKKYPWLYIENGKVYCKVDPSYKILSNYIMFSIASTITRLM